MLIINEEENITNIIVESIINNYSRQYHIIHNWKEIIHLQSINSLENDLIGINQSRWLNWLIVINASYCEIRERILTPN